MRYPDINFERDELERWHGSLDPTPEEAYDHARAREDRLDDHHLPATAPAWMTPPALTHQAPCPVRPPSPSFRGAGPGRAQHRTRNR